MLFVWAVFRKEIFKFSPVCLITRGDKTNITDKRKSVFKEIISSEKKVNIDLNRCYERYAEYFRMTFPLAASPKFQEWVNDISATSEEGVGSTTDEQCSVCR